MVKTAERRAWSANRLSERLVRYAELRPCTTAFIDTRTPGSKEKENFTIIGPGVAESPDQYVHIDIPHGFNIGAARQPPGCVNSQHSHETAEVFVVHKGRWAFYLGADREDGAVELEAGDTISIPIHVFRGFENIGKDVGFMFAVLGGDDPGHVTWAPYVFEQANQYGLILLEDGSLVDTTRGEQIPTGKRRIRATTATDVAKLRKMSAEELQDCVVRASELTQEAACTLAPAGIREYPIIGAESPAEGMAAGRMSWPHGFQVRHVAVDPQIETYQHSRGEEEVVMMHRGLLTLEFPDGEIDLTAGDVLTVPIGMPRKFCNKSSETAEAYVVRGGDHPRPADIINGTRNARL